MHGRGPRWAWEPSCCSPGRILAWAATALGASGPETKTEPALQVTKTTAKLTGTVNPKGVAVNSCQFKYGTARVAGLDRGMLAETR